MNKIKNRPELLSAGEVPSRQIVLDIADKALERLDAYVRIKRIMWVEGDTLYIGQHIWNLAQKRNIYLIAAGKACNAMAMAVDEILGDKLTQGYAIVKIPEKTDRYKNTKVFVGGHPIPNREGLNACLEILTVVDNAGPQDLFITAMSGGSSALMSCPIPGISLEDEMEATDVLLKSGANILEINAIRRHISQMNGGGLAKRIQARGAEMIGFNIFDAIGFPPTKLGEACPNMTGTPIGGDNTTLEDARAVIQNYDLGDRLPGSIAKYLMHCGPEGETVSAFPQFTYFVINTLPDACRYAKEAAEEMGIPAIILTSFLEGESREAGTVFASIAREIQAHGNPVQAPCVVVATGETTTRIPDNSLIQGHGGPSQELVAGFALTAHLAPGACMLSIDSEGTDGTTHLAGAITDAKTLGEAGEAGVDLYQALRGHACFEALSTLRCGVVTGNTGTNICDLDILYVPALHGDEGPV